jgi:hypothetical protein
MNLFQVTDEKFKRYGRVMTEIDVTELIEKMQETESPEEVVYVPSVPELEALPICKELTESVYGELPIQIGYCNGKNKFLNAVEYHRSSEINVAATDLVLMLGKRADVSETFSYDSSRIEAFFLPKGTVVEVFGDTLHYAPCHTEEDGFKAVVVLPKGTNYDLIKEHGTKGEEKLLFAVNKWLIAHPDAKIEGAFNGITGENLKLD